MQSAAARPKRLICFMDAALWTTRATQVQFGRVGVESVRMGKTPVRADGPVAKLRELTVERIRHGSTSYSQALIFVPLALAHHQVHGPSIGYAAIALAAAVSWFGLPGPGEAVLIAAGVLAAHHRLDIAMVIALAVAGAIAGGVAGWLVGMKASRPLLTARGPLRRTRRALIARGERFFERHGPLGVFATPSWAAGVHNIERRGSFPSTRSLRSAGRLPMGAQRSC